MLSSSSLGVLRPDDIYDPSSGVLGLLWVLLNKPFFHSMVSGLDVWRRPVMLYNYVILLLGYHVSSQQHVSRL